VLPFHERGHGLLVNILLDQVVIGSTAGIEYFSARVDQGFHQWICASFVLGLDVIGGAGMSNVGVIPSEYHGGTISSK
jgi:hypothetical protein